MQPFTIRLVSMLLAGVGGLLLSGSISTAQQPPPNKSDPTTRVDRYGDPLPTGVVSRLGTVRFRTGQPLGPMAITPDGKVIATHDHKLWNVATGKPFLSWKSDFGLYRFVFDPDGKTLVCDTGGNVVEVVDRVTGKVLRNIKVEIQRRDQAALSGDGRKFICLNNPEKAPVEGVPATVVVSDVATGRETLRLQKPEFPAMAIGISHDGSQFACAGFDKNIRLYAADKGTLIRTFKGRPVQVIEFRFDPTGRILLVQEQDRSLSLWNIAKGEEIRRIPFGCEAFAFSRDGKRLAASGYHGTTEEAMVHVWDVATGKELFPAVRSPDGTVADLAFFPDGKTLAGTTYGGWIRLWDLATGKEKAQPGHQAAIHSIAFGKEGLTLATGGSDGTVRLWDPRTGEERRAWETAWRTSVIAFSPDRTLLACAGHGSIENDKPAPIVFWDPLTGKETLRLPGHPGGVFSLAFAPDAKTLASGGGDKLIRLWDLPGQRPLLQLRGHGATPGNLAFAPSGRMLASSAADGSVRLWETVTGAPRGQFSFAGGNVNIWDGTASSIFFDGDIDGYRGGPGQPRFGPLFFSENGKTLLMGGDDQSLDVVFSPKAADQSATEPQAEIRAIRYYSITRYQGPSRYSLRVVDLATGKVSRRVPERMLPASMDCAVRSADRKRLAWVNGNVITAWDLERNQMAGSWATPQAAVTALAFSPDDGLLASAGSDGTVLIWDLPTMLARKPVAPLSAEVRAKQLEATWAELADADAGKAYQAMWQMARHKADAVAFLKPRLEAVPPIEPAQLARWVAELDDEDFDTRARAANELAKRDDAIPYMLKALRNQPSLECRRRLEQLLDQLDKQPSPEFLRAYRAVELLEQIGTPEAIEILDRLAQGAPQARLTVAAAAARTRLQN